MYITLIEKTVIYIPSPKHLATIIYSYHVNYAI